MAVATGPSFSFLYRENLELLEGAGAEVVTFDPTTEDLPAGTDALYLGGGFPETYAEALSTNGRMRESPRPLQLVGVQWLPSAADYCTWCASWTGIRCAACSTPRPR